MRVDELVEVSQDHEALHELVVTCVDSRQRERATERKTVLVG